MNYFSSMFLDGKIKKNIQKLTLSCGLESERIEMARNLADP